MPIDPNIILGVKPAQIQQTDPMDSYAKSLTLQHLMKQGDLADVNLASAKQGQQNSASTRAAVMAGGTPEEVGQRILQSGDIKGYQDYTKNLSETALRNATIGKDNAAAGKSNYDVQMGRLQHGAALFNEAKDPQSFDEVLRVGLATKTFDPEFVQQFQGKYTPELVEKFKAAGVTREKQLEAQNRAATLTETARGHDLTNTAALRGQDMTAATANAGQGVTMRGQNMVDARAKQTLDQPKMHYDADRGILVNERTGSTQPAVGPDGQPVGQKPLKPTEAYLKNQTGVANVRSAIGEYKTALDSFKMSDLASPDARARMGTSYNNMMLQAKEAYNLGVLNGPDYMILQQVVTNPLTLKGGITSNAAMKDQATHLDKIMAKISETSAAVHGQTPPAVASAPAAAPAPPKLGARVDGYIYKGGDPANPKSWEK